MKQVKTRDLTCAAVIAALYVVLTVLQNVLLPGSTSMAVQFRLSEALCVLALFSPCAIAGLSVGCMVFNLTYAGALPLDFLLGTAATALSGITMYLLRGVRLRTLPLPALLMPALFNGLLVGGELTVYIGNTFWYNALCVAAGEAAVLLVLGTTLYYALRARGLSERLFGR